MNIELSFYPVGSGYGATLKTESGNTKVYLDGANPLDAIVGVLCSCFCSNSESRALLHVNVDNVAAYSEKPAPVNTVIERPQRAPEKPKRPINFSVAL